MKSNPFNINVKKLIKLPVLFFIIYIATCHQLYAQDSVNKNQNKISVAIGAGVCSYGSSYLARI